MIRRNVGARHYQSHFVGITDHAIFTRPKTNLNRYPSRRVVGRTMDILVVSCIIGLLAAALCLVVDDKNEDNY